MIVAAGRLLEQRDFDSVSIRDLARAASCSIGSFYYRFQTKEHFFQVLIQDMIDRREQQARETFQSLPLAELPSALARGALANFRTHKGLLRSVIKKHLEGMRSWEPIARMGRRIATEFQRRVADERGANANAIGGRAHRFRLCLAVWAAGPEPARPQHHFWLGDAVLRRSKRSTPSRKPLHAHCNAIESFPCQRPIRIARGRVSASDAGDAGLSSKWLHPRSSRIRGRLVLRNSCAR